MDVCVLICSCKPLDQSKGNLYIWILIEQYPASCVIGSSVQLIGSLVQWPISFINCFMIGSNLWYLENMAIWILFLPLVLFVVIYGIELPLWRVPFVNGRRPIFSGTMSPLFGNVPFVPNLKNRSVFPCTSAGSFFPSTSI